MAQVDAHGVLLPHPAISAGARATSNEIS